jgi:hypothetical protein
MKKAVTLAAACVAAALSAGSLQAAPKPNITDPLGDANFVNDQGTGDGSVGDQTAADAGTVSDITAVTFSNDKKNLYVAIETEAAPPATTGIGYRVRVNPDATGTHCILFEAFFPGANNVLTAGEAQVRNACAGGDPVKVDVLGTTLIVPRKVDKAFKKGGKLKSPQAQAFLYSGTSYPAGVAGPMADTTKVGKDFKFKK